VSLKEKTSVEQVMKSGIIHSFGLGERHSAGYNVSILLRKELIQFQTLSVLRARYQLDHDKRKEELGKF
jgi:hypothetical protein